MLQSINTSSWDQRHKSWRANASFDNKTWETVDTKTEIDTGFNTNPFELDKTVNCKHFRIIQKANSCDNNCFISLIALEV